MSKSSWKMTPEMEFAKAVAKAQLAGMKFYIYRTVDAAVKKIELSNLSVTLEQWPQELWVHYTDERGLNVTSEKATKMDLQLIAQQAKQQIRAAATK